MTDQKKSEFFLKGLDDQPTVTCGGCGLGFFIDPANPPEPPYECMTCAEKRTGKVPVFSEDGKSLELVHIH